MEVKAMLVEVTDLNSIPLPAIRLSSIADIDNIIQVNMINYYICLLYTSPSPRDS